VGARRAEAEGGDDLGAEQHDEHGRHGGQVAAADAGGQRERGGEQGGQGAAMTIPRTAVCDRYLGFFLQVRAL
jgi:hypothetical protein